jgi:lysophospholipase L1-like esterase
MHNKKTCRAAVAAATATLLVLSAAARAEGLILHRGDLVVTSGDSITYMSHYSRLVEIYLLVTRPELELRVMKCQRGCGGSAGEFVANTLEEELVGLKPNVHTVCFGMNDGGRGEPWREATGEAYARALRRIVERNHQNGTLTLVASPGVVDSLSYTVGPGAGADGYNRTLANLTAIAKKVAEETGCPFADIHHPMMRMMKGAEADYGVRFPRTRTLRDPSRFLIIADDGIHPGNGGHLAMAYGLLKGMGFDGNIGGVEWDWATGQATADPAQRILSSASGKIVVESDHIPLCLSDVPAGSEGPWQDPCYRYYFPYLPFMHDLNRYTLRVKNLRTARARVTWGNRSLIFTRTQLDDGVNLAEEFPENPFSTLIAWVDQAVLDKQVYEREMYDCYLNVRMLRGDLRQPQAQKEATEFFKTMDKFIQRYLPNDAKARTIYVTLRERMLGQHDQHVSAEELSALREAALARDREYHAAARALIRPVRHTILVEPL